MTADTRHDEGAARTAAAYDAVVTAGGTQELGATAQSLRSEFERRTGAFGPDDPWFEARTRAFWDDALTSRRFAVTAREALPADLREFGVRFARAHRGLFLATDRGARGARLLDVWSGAELLVRHLDETQALTVEHAEGFFDARVVSTGEAATLVVLPGALHHPPDATEPLRRVLDEARRRDLSTEDALDALMRMELVLRSSSRVKPGFAYSASRLPTP